MTSHQKVKYVLGVETSCDDTAIGIIDSSKNIKANIVLNQNNYHKEFGGIVPEIAARAHLSFIDIALKKALMKAKIKLEEIDLFCSTGGPGLIGGLIVGNTFCKTLAWSFQKPFLAINHLEGHALTARLLYDDLNYPFLLLLVSGGHTQLIAVLNYGEYIRIGTTLDDSAGETFDKAAKMMGLDQPGGPLIEKLSEGLDSSKIEFYMIDINKNEELANTYNIKSIPTFLFFHKNELKDQCSGSDINKVHKLLKDNMK